jgi:hypothetical protein
LELFLLLSFLLSLACRHGGWGLVVWVVEGGCWKGGGWKGGEMERKGKGGKEGKDDIRSEREAGGCRCRCGCGCKQERVKGGRNEGVARKVREKRKGR